MYVASLILSLALAPEPSAGEPSAPMSTDPAAAAAPPALHRCDRQAAHAKFRITLPKEAELDALVQWMMSVSCQRFIWDPKIRGGQVTIMAPDEVTVEEAYAAFYAALQTMGLTVEPAGQYLKIVEAQGVAARTLPVFDPDHRPPPDDRYVTQLHRIGAARSDDVVALLEALKGKQGSVTHVGDLLVITDTGANVRRMLEVVAQLDDPALVAERIYFVQPRDASAEDLAETIRQLFGESAPVSGKPSASGGKSDGARASRVIVDARTNTLVIVAQAEDFAVIRALVDKLDVKTAGGQGQIRVVRLKNARAENVADVLNQLASGTASTRSAGKDGKAPAPTSPAAASLGSVLTGSVRVTPDPDTRAVVVMASASDFLAIKEVIAELDTPRKQVYLECYLLEVSVEKTMNLGASAHFGKSVGSGENPGLGYVSSQTTDGNSLQLGSSMLSGLAAGVLGPAISGTSQLNPLGTDIPSFGVVIQALALDTDVNFVAEPHIYTADNKPAKIEVGRTVPTVGATTTVPSGNTFAQNTQVERVKVALSLQVTPHVNDERTVSLDIELANDSTVGVPDPKLGVTTTQRKITLEEVVARDDQPIVLGGLVQEVESETVKSVPGLGKIPVLGWLFRNRGHKREKVNLLLVMVPHILDSPDDARRIHERRMAERLEFLERSTAFKRRDLDTHVNYRRKSGLLAAINVEAERMDAEAAEIGRAEHELSATPVSGEIGLAPQATHARDDGAAARPAAPPPAAAGGSRKP